jgi:hypothetical protein
LCGVSSIGYSTRTSLSHENVSVIIINHIHSLGITKIFKKNQSKNKQQKTKKQKAKQTNKQIGKQPNKKM